MRKHVVVRLAAIFLAATAPLLAGFEQVTPEPSLVVLTAVGVGAIIVIARKKRSK